MAPSDPNKPSNRPDGPRPPRRNTKGPQTRSRTTAASQTPDRSEGANQQSDMIYGIRAVLESLDAQREIDRVLIRKGLTGDLVQELRQELRRRHIPVQAVPPETLERNCPGRRHQGVVAFVAAATFVPYSQLIPQIFEYGDTPLLLALDGVTDVRNLGAIARTAEALGVHGLLLPMLGSARLGADAMKTSAGALNYLPICRVAVWDKTLPYLQKCGLRVLGCTERGRQMLGAADLTTPVCLMLGAEDRGLSPDVLDLCDDTIRIPMKGHIDALNVSVAAGMAIYETLRQREAQASPSA